MIRPARLAIALFLLSLSIAPGQTPAQTAQSPNWTLDGPAFSASAADLRAAAAAIPAAPFAETTVLFEQEKFALAADGRLTHTHQLLYRIETKTGVEDWDQAAVQWDPWYQSQPTIHARSIQPDGHVSELDPKTLTDVPAKNQGDGTFSSARVYKAPLPSISIGAIVEQETVVADKSPFFTGGNAYHVYFSRGVPTLRSRLIVETPSEAPFQFRVHSLPESLPKIEQSGGIRRATFDLTSVPLSIRSDIDLATDRFHYPSVEFSTGASWAAVVAAYQKVAEPQIQPESIKPLLPPSLPADYLAAIQTLASRLHKEVRYTGIEFGESAIRPQDPSEVLKRHYGDCKDKAAFLVAMLRASGIPANLALLQAGPGGDVNPDLPGMNQFDHAIVHVPASAKGPELWIDATAEFTRVGDLPYDDQGRLALIVADGTTQLTRIPDPKPEDSVLIETRDFTLQQFGPAKVVEFSASTGHIDADYRYLYGGQESKATHEDLEKYAKRVYVAKALTKVIHTEGSDLNQPFTLRLEMAEATRGVSDVTDAAVAVPPGGPISQLPSWFGRDPDPDNAKLTPEQLSDRHKAEQERAPEYLIKPFITEWRYHITLPVGFEPHSLPADDTLHFGPATLTRHFEAVPAQGAPTVVNAVLRLNTVKQRYSLDEVLAARQAVLEMNRQNYILLTFDQSGAKLLAAGKTREALATDRALIAAHPAEPIHHVQLAAVLLSAGLGAQAQQEARKATELDPKSAVAFLQLALALEHNDIGIEYGTGFDRAATIEAYKKAKLLDPENTTARVNLAILYEHNAEGDRYTEDANLTDAVREYRELKEVDKATYERYLDNLHYAMLYNRQFKELLAELDALPSTPTRDSFAIAAIAASQSLPAAMKRADRISGDAPQKAALRRAGFQLMRLNLYPQAAALLNASIQGQSDAAQIARQAEIFSTLSHKPPPELPATDPRAPVQLMLTAMMNGKLAPAVPLFMTRHAFATDAEWKKNLEHNDVNIIQILARQADFPTAVMRDIVLGNAKLTSEGDETHGFRITMQALGAGDQNLFVSRDEGKFKIVADSNDSAEVGNYALYLLANKRETEARSLLDWKRDQVHRGGGDDPLEGDLFARFWTVGQGATPDATPDAIRIAALALTLQKPDSQAALEPALAAYAKSPGDPDLTLLLASAYSNHNDAANAKIYLDKLLAKYPTSITAITMLGHVYELSRDFTSWRAMLDSRLAKRPNDHDLLVQSAYEAQAESDFPRARAAFQKVIDVGKPTSADYNGLAWLGLFDNHVDAKSIEAAVQSNTMSKNESFAELHTLACLYAAQGKTTEARELLLKAMEAGQESVPNTEVWFGFASIYEQFGLDEAAIAAYKKVTRPDGPVVSPVDTYTLAQARLKALRAN